MRAGTGSTLEAAVADTVGAEVVELEDVIASDLVYDAFVAHRDLRISGIAVTAAGRLPWSLIEKTTAGPVLASAYLVDNGRRECAAYCSGLLDELPVGVRAPALRGVDERPDGAIVLRLEDVPLRAVARPSAARLQPAPLVDSPSSVTIRSRWPTLKTKHEPWSKIQPYGSRCNEGLTRWPPGRSTGTSQTWRRTHWSTICPAPSIASGEIKTRTQSRWSSRTRSTWPA